MMKSYIKRAKAVGRYSNSNVRVRPVIRPDTLTADREQRDDEPESRQPSRAPEARRVLLRNAVALPDVDFLGDGGGDGQGDAGADLEGCVEHATAETLHVDGDRGEDEGAGCNEDEGDGCDADEGGREDVDPAGFVSLGSFIYISIRG